MNLQNAPLVVVPTYNERENIVAIVEAVMALPDAFELLVVDEIGRASCRERVFRAV